MVLLCFTDCELFIMVSLLEAVETFSVALALALVVALETGSVFIWRPLV